MTGQAPWLAWLAATTPACGVTLAGASLRVHRARAARPALRALARKPDAQTAPSLDRWYAHLGATRLGRGVERTLVSSGRFARRLEMAGRPWTPCGAAGRIVASAFAGACLIVAIGAIAPVALVLMPIGVTVGARLPSLVLARRARARQARIETQVPELVELLVAASESGLPPPTAFVRSAEALSPPLGDLLREASAEIELGSPWREALDATVARTTAQGLARLARSLERSHRLGATVATSLHALVGELRAERQMRAEEKARRAPVKMLFPLVFLILPAFLLLTVGPVLLSTVRSLH